MNEYENISGRSTVNVLIVPLIIILNEICLTFENVKGLDLFLYIIGMFCDVFTFTWKALFF